MIMGWYSDILSMSYKMNRPNGLYMKLVETKICQILSSMAWNMTYIIACPTVYA